MKLKKSFYQVDKSSVTPVSEPAQTEESDAGESIEETEESAAEESTELTGSVLKITGIA